MSFQYGERGVAHSNGLTVAFAVDTGTTFAMVAREGAPSADPPEVITESIRAMRETEESRYFLMVVDGSLPYLRLYQAGVQGAQFAIYCSDEATLKAMGVPIVDEHWQETDSQLQLDEILMTMAGVQPEKLGQSGKPKGHGSMLLAMGAAFVGYELGKHLGDDASERPAHVCHNCMIRPGTWSLDLDTGHCFVCDTCLVELRDKGEHIGELMPAEEDIWHT